MPPQEDHSAAALNTTLTTRLTHLPRTQVQTG